MLPRSLHRLLARLALVWFALALGVAAASPLVQPRAMQLVCSASGSIKLLVEGGEGWTDAQAAHQIDCALCLPVGAPPPIGLPGLPAALRMPQAVVPPLAAAPAVARALAPLPARGPPALS